MTSSLCFSLADHDVDNRRDCSFASASARTRNGKGCQFSATKDRAGWEARGGSSSSCPLRVISRHNDPFESCPLYPQKRTFVSAGWMSEKCHKQTYETRI